MVIMTMVGLVINLMQKAFLLKVKFMPRERINLMNKVSEFLMQNQTWSVFFMEKIFICTMLMLCRKKTAPYGFIPASVKKRILMKTMMALS